PPLAPPPFPTRRSSDLHRDRQPDQPKGSCCPRLHPHRAATAVSQKTLTGPRPRLRPQHQRRQDHLQVAAALRQTVQGAEGRLERSEEHTSELQSLTNLV